MEFGDDIVNFKIFEAMKYPVEEHSIFLGDIIDVVVDSIETFTDSLADFAEFSYFDFSSLNCTYDESAVCNICAEIAIAI